MANEVEIHVVVHRRGNLNDIARDIKRDYAHLGQDAGRHFGEEFTTHVRRKIRGGGRGSGKSFGRSFVEGFGGMVASAARVAADFGNAMARSLARNPAVATAVGLAVLAGVVAILPVIGGAIAGAVAFGLGAGLATIGIIFAAKSEAIKKEWGKVFKELGKEMRTISEPFEDTLQRATGFIRRTFRALKPDLEDTFKDLGPTMTKFFDIIGKSLERFAPALQPLGDAFRAIVDSLGDQFPGMMEDLANSITGVANSIKDNPETFVMVLGWVKNMITFTLDLSAGLNKIAGFFEKIPGFGAAINVLLISLAAGFAPVLFLFDAISRLGETGQRKVLLDLKEGLGEAAHAAREAAQSVTAFIDTMRAAIDPQFAFAKAQREVTDAQKAYSKAVKKHGANSREAKEALEDLTLATLGLNAASLKAGTGTGKLTSAQRAALRAAGMTESQIRALERQLARAAAAADRLRVRLRLLAARTYRAKVIVLYEERGIRVAGITGRGGFFAAQGGNIGGIGAFQHGGNSGSAFGLVGERGPELVRLPFGSTVIPAGTTKNMLSTGAGGGVAKVQLDFRGLPAWLLDYLRNQIRIDGGNVQVSLGS
ncbi:MAG: hypothetical protein ACREQA_19740 [Candidatus Binatia bacterium]